MKGIRFEKAVLSDFCLAVQMSPKSNCIWTADNLEVNKTKSKNSPTLKNSQKFVRWGQWFNTRSISEKVINFEITDFSMYGDFLPKIDASFS